MTWAATSASASASAVAASGTAKTNSSVEPDTEPESGDGLENLDVGGDGRGVRPATRAEGRQDVDEFTAFEAAAYGPAPFDVE